MTTWTVETSGGDYTTLQLALVNASTVDGDTISIPDGDWTSAPNTVKAIVADDNITIVTAGGSRHAGVDNGGTNFKLATTADRSLEVQNTGCIVDGLIIEQTSTSTSNECIRVTASGGTFTLTNSILRCTNNTSDQDGLYVGNIGATINAEKVYAIGCGRAGFHAQQFNGSNTQTWNLESIGAWNCGRFSGEIDGGGVCSWATAAGATNNHNIFNSFALENTAGGSDNYNNAADGAQSGTRNWQIDDCISSDSSDITDRDSGAVGSHLGYVIGESDTSDAQGDVIVNDITSAPFDLRLTDVANNDAEKVHSNTTGATLTLSTADIAGTTRVAAFDIGPFEIEAGGGGTIVAATGAYTWTGTAATLLHSSVMAAASGSYAWTGQAALLLKGSTIVAASGSYAWTGQTASLLFNAVIQAESGSYAWAGTAATLLHNSILTADAGSYAWTGQAAVLLKDSVVVAATGSYAWTGQNASLLFNALIAAEAGAYTWTGTAATLTHLTGATLIADAGSYSWTGAAVTFLHDTVMPADSGAYLWTGQAATLKHGTGDGDYGVVSQGTGVTLGTGMTHMDSVGFSFVSTPLTPENEI